LHELSIGFPIQWSVQMKRIMPAAFLAFCIVGPSVRGASLPPPDALGYRYFNGSPQTLTLPAGSFIAEQVAGVITTKLQEDVSFVVGTLRQQVYREDATGALDFIYTLTPGNSGVSLDVFAVAWPSPATRIVDSGYLAAAPGALVPALIFRAYDASPADFFFATGEPGAGIIPSNMDAGVASLVLRTTATEFTTLGRLDFVTIGPSGDPNNFDLGFGSAIGLAPAASGAVPEVSSLVLVGVSVVGLLVRKRRAAQ
jgi:hypothetical protein